jgi:tRNA threonylcarbamoyladenosine biosynthesis protein TsaB
MAAKYLILETSGRVGQVALAEGQDLRGVRQLDEARRHARDLAPAVAALLAEQGWAPREVQAVIVSRGPGSYTGLRVGIMSAKTFAYATDCALLAVNTFEAVALQAPPDTSLLDVVADAQQDKIYVQRFARGEDSAWKPVWPLRIQAIDGWLRELPRNSWVTGPGLAAYGPKIPEATLLVSPKDWNPRVESLLRLGHQRYLAGERDDLWTVEPLYLRPSAAEEKWVTRATP